MSGRAGLRPMAALAGVFLGLLGRGHMAAAQSPAPGPGVEAPGAAGAGVGVGAGATAASASGVAAPNAVAAVEPGVDRWFVVELAGERAGWMRESQSFEAGDIRTETEMRLEIRRGAISIAMKLGTSFLETRAGEPLEMVSVQDLGVGQETRIVYRFEDDGVVVERSAPGAAAWVQRRPRPEGGWLTPARAEARTAGAIAGGEGVIEFTTLDPTTGLDPVSIRRVLGERAVVEVLGRRVEAVRSASTSSALPGVTSIEYLDFQGRVVRTEMEALGLPMTMLSADEALALSPLRAPELMAASFITPDRPIADPRSARRMAYGLSVTEGELPPPPQTGSQRVSRVGPGAARVEVDVTARGEPVGAGVDRARLLMSTGAIQAEDPEVVALAARGRGAGAAELAEDLRRIVYGHIDEKALSVGFASAAETARSREGDCTEHAVLLAAMLRARGVPSRVAGGVIYADSFAGERGIFVYHMWTQALVADGAGVERWVELDATLPAGTPFDATHIALSVSDLSGDSPVHSLAALAPLMGRLRIGVEAWP